MLRCCFHYAACGDMRCCLPSRLTSAVALQVCLFAMQSGHLRSSLPASLSPSPDVPQKTQTLTTAGADLEILHGSEQTSYTCTLEIKEASMCSRCTGIRFESGQLVCYLEPSGYVDALCIMSLCLSYCLSLCLNSLPVSVPSPCLYVLSLSPAAALCVSE